MSSPVVNPIYEPKCPVDLDKLAADIALDPLEDMIHRVRALPFRDFVRLRRLYKAGLWSPVPAPRADVEPVVEPEHEWPQTDNPWGKALRATWEEYASHRS